MTILIIYLTIAVGFGLLLYRDGASPAIAVASAVYWPVLALIALVLRLP